MLSDHTILLININIQKPPWPVKYINHRKLKIVDINQIKKDIKINGKMVEICNTNKLVSLYNHLLHMCTAQTRIIVCNVVLYYSELDRYCDLPFESHHKDILMIFIKVSALITNQYFSHDQLYMDFYCMIWY